MAKKRERKKERVRTATVSVIIPIQPRTAECLPRANVSPYLATLSQTHRAKATFPVAVTATN